MKKAEIIDIITKSVKPQEMCRIFFKYYYNYSYHFPLKTSDKLFLSADEDDFILNGFSIRRFCDIRKVELKNDKCVEIIKKEGILDNLNVPDIDVTNWYTVFNSLAESDTNIIIEKESLDDGEWEFAIGKIIKVLKTKVIFKDFDADGIWQEEYCEIPYSQITTVTFASRYVDVFSKYV